MAFVRTAENPIALAERSFPTIATVSLALLSENELWLALNKGDEIEIMHLADDVHHTWKLTGQNKDNLRKARAEGAV